MIINLSTISLRCGDATVWPHEIFHWRLYRFYGRASCQQ